MTKSIDLDAYLARIGYDAAPRPDADTLIGLHRAHRIAIPYENFDVQLGIPVSTDPHAAFGKIVQRGRGGWCYEMNGTLALALEAIGFRVTRMAGAVMREQGGDALIGNHLVLLIHLDEPWFADVGFGAGGPLDPAPLREGPLGDDFRKLRLERVQGGWWRFHALAASGPPSFDFHPERTDQHLMDATCAQLQSDPQSIFVNNAITMRVDHDRALTLRDADLTIITAEGPATRTLPDLETYLSVLKDLFRLELAEAARLWQRYAVRQRT